MKQEIKKPNVLWIMSDQHNANCTGYAGHPNVKTPNLDRIASMGVNFTHAFANNPICAPSRISFITGQYCHTHRMFSNDYREYPTSNPNTLACLFRRYGYQTAIVGKSHMVPRWDKEGFEFIRYTDLIDASLMAPTTVHHFKYLDDLGLADYYEEGTAKKGQEYTLDGSAPAHLPYEHSIEHFTGNEAVNFLNARDGQRPFFLLMSFQRPHGPIAPAREHFNMYAPENMVLPDNAFDYFENRFAGKPDIIRKRVEDRCRYPLAHPEPKRLKRCLASYYTLISVIDSEKGTGKGGEIW